MLCDHGSEWLVIVKESKLKEIEFRRKRSVLDPFVRKQKVSYPSAIHLHGLLLPRQVIDGIPKALADLDLLARVDSKLEVGRRLENEHDRASEAETAHFLSRRQGLAAQNRGCRRVDSFGVSSRWRRLAADVRAEGLARIENQR